MELLIASTHARKTYDVSPITTGEVSWTTERTGAAGKLSFTLVKHGDINYHEGNLTQLILNEQKMFSGYVFKKMKNINEIATTCYDQLRYLKAKQSYNIKNMTVGGVIKLIAAEFGLKVGHIEDTRYVLPTKLYEDKTLLDIITDCVSRTTLATGTVYVFYDSFGALTLRRAADLKSPYVIGNGSFGLDYTYETSIDDSYNYIKLVRPNKKTGKADTYIAEDKTAIKEWGKLQYYEKVDEDLNAAQIREMTKRYLQSYCHTGRQLKLSAIGIPSMRAGSMVMIDIPDLGDIRLKKMLLVEKCTHKISSGSHTMDLEMKVYDG